MNKKTIIIMLLCFVLVVVAGIGAGFIAGNILRSRPVEEITEVNALEKNTANEATSEENTSGEEITVSEQSSETITYVYSVEETSHIYVDEEIEYIETEAEQQKLSNSDIENAVLEIVRSSVPELPDNFVIFDCETRENGEEIQYVVRYQGSEKTPNKLYAYVTVNKNDGKMILERFPGEENIYYLW